MLSLVLLAVGLLGIAGSSSLSLRAVALHDGSRRVTRQAALRLAALEALGCAAARDGVADDPAAGIHESWHVAPLHGGSEMVDDSIAWSALGRRRQLVIRGALLC